MPKQEVFLFLDLEITGFDLAEDQIIELAAAICEFKGSQLEVVHTFSSLIKPSIQLPDHIPRLTGLNVADFADSPDQPQVRKDWQTWIDQAKLPEKEVTVVGHSVSNDINFLKYNHFWLPPSPENQQQQAKNTPKFCDTLNLAKLVLVDQSNLNLEYLAKSLGLSQSVIRKYNQPKSQPKLQSKSNKSLDSTQNQTALRPHRALYDSLIGVELYNFCLDRLDKLALPEQILSFMRSSIGFSSPSKSLNPIPSNFNIPAGTDSTHEAEQQPKAEAVPLDFNGLPIISTLENRLAQNPPSPASLIDELSNPLLPNKLKTALAQIYLFLGSLSWSKSNQSGKMPRLHTYGLGERVHLEVALSTLGSTTLPSSLIQIQPQYSSQDRYCIPNFEKILTGVGEIVETEFELVRFSFLNDVLAELYQLEFQAKFPEQISIEIDFLLARVEILLQQNTKKELQIHPPGQNNDLDLNDIYLQFQNIFYKLEKLSVNLSEIPATSIWTKQLLQLHKELLSKFENQSWSGKTLIVRLSKNQIKLNFLKNKFSWSDYWSKLSQIPNLTLTTHLDENHWHMLGDLMSMPDDLFNLPNQIVTQECSKELETKQVASSKTTLELLQNMEEELDGSSVHLILCGQNSGLSHVIELAVENLDHKNFLAIGETGSLAKIIGKVRMGFRGLVIIKSTDIFLLQQLSGTPIFHTATMIQPPQINLNQFWFSGAKDAKALILNTRRILKNSIAGQLSTQGVNLIYYQPEIVK